MKGKCALGFIKTERNMEKKGYKRYRDKIYLSTEEVQQDKRFGWSRATLYNLYKGGAKLTPVKFPLDRLTYWDEAELLAIKDRPPEPR